MIKQTPKNSSCVGNLFLPVPDTNLKELLADVLELKGKCPEILASINKDQDVLGIKKKELRQKDKAYFEKARYPGMMMLAKGSTISIPSQLGLPQAWAIPIQTMIKAMMLTKGTKKRSITCNEKS